MLEQEERPAVLPGEQKELEAAASPLAVAARLSCWHLGAQTLGPQH